MLTHVHREDEYAQLLQSQQLWPVDPIIEQNWSGRGQHAKFEKDEQSLINSILEVQDDLGSTRTATVQSVKCRRILLARKTIACGKQTMTRDEAIKEVSHLTRVDHAHILRVIGTYVKGRHLSILLYPVADYNLEGFFEEFRATPQHSSRYVDMVFAGIKFYDCLSSAVRTIHQSLTKHMDIKPQNILVRARSYDEDEEFGPIFQFDPYIADFGIARSYETLQDTETDGHTSFTRRYAAPEVVQQGNRGLSADIFSLGCVFLEICSTLRKDRSIIERALRAVLNANERADDSYQANAGALQAHLTGGLYDGQWEQGLIPPLSLIARMLSIDPESRPTAEELVADRGERPCCTAGAEPLEAMANSRAKSGKSH
jgi:serine/threonine protein kinase